MVLDLKNGKGSISNSMPEGEEDVVVFTVSDEDFMSMARKETQVFHFP